VSTNVPAVQSQQKSQQYPDRERNFRYRPLEKRNLARHPIFDFDDNRLTRILPLERPSTPGVPESTRNRCLHCKISRDRWT